MAKIGGFNAWAAARGTNMGKLKELAINGLKILALGVLVGTGVRAAEWAIPAPELRVIVCTMDDLDHVETCTSAAELLKNMPANVQGKGRAACGASRGGRRPERT